MILSKYRLPVLGLVAVALAIGLWFDRAKGEAGSPPRSGTASKILKLSTDYKGALDGLADYNRNPLSTLTQNQLHATISRPLFVPSRRPPIIKKTRKFTPRIIKRAPPKREEFVLKGIISSGLTSIALLQSKSSGASFRVERGDAIGKWRVTHIDGDRVRLENGIAKVVLPIFK